MLLKDIEKQIRDFIANDLLDDPSANLDGDTPLLELGILDSLKMVELVAHIEQGFSVRIKPEEIVAVYFRDLKSICGLIQKHLQEVGKYAA